MQLNIDAFQVRLETRGEVIENGNLLDTVLTQPPDQVRADEAGAAGDEGPHALMLGLASAPIGEPTPCSGSRSWRATSAIR